VNNIILEAVAYYRLLHVACACATGIMQVLPSRSQFRRLL